MSMTSDDVDVKKSVRLIVTVLLLRLVGFFFFLCNTIFFLCNYLILDFTYTDNGFLTLQKTFACSSVRNLGVVTVLEKVHRTNLCVAGSFFALQRLCMCPVLTKDSFFH